MKGSETVITKLVVWIRATLKKNFTTNFEKHHVCDKDTAFKGIQEHKDVLDAIRSMDTAEAKNAMKNVNDTFP